jgi:hypothetical protein
VIQVPGAVGANRPIYLGERPALGGGVVV